MPDSAVQTRKRSTVRRLMDKGVAIPAPESIEIAHDVNLDNISGSGVTLHAGCKIFGSRTLISSDVTLGYEGPVTVDDCQLGPQVALNGGFFKEAVFLAGARAGSGAHVREATILEEQARIAHTVALKQTILFPFVTLGSLINFCDVLMAGGTGRNNHSEVGSSYIHFNYTPNQDKATASLLGNVPQGVMLNQRPIFLGGQGGLVGPCRLAFGTTVAAGSICRKDELRPGRLLFEGKGRGGSIPAPPGFYRTIKRIIVNNIYYIANLRALEQWYRHVRRLFVAPGFPEPLYAALAAALEKAVSERIGRLASLALKMPESLAVYQSVAGEKASVVLMGQKQTLYHRWPEVQAALASVSNDAGHLRLRDAFLNDVTDGIATHGKNYLSVIQSLPSSTAATGTGWLDSVVEQTVDGAMACLPDF